MLKKLFGFHGGLKLDEHKDVSTRLPVQPARLPRRLIVPVQQHIGSPATPLVSVGDAVLKGQKIARTGDTVSAPVHAPSSGTVVDIGDYPIPHPSGMLAPCIVIETDGREAWADHPPLGDWRLLQPDEIRERVREAGIVGLGGAGFPSFIKLNPNRQAVETLILNGAECEPYITCDDMLMRDRPEEVIQGLLIMQRALDARECVIGLEDNKPEAYEALEQARRALGAEGVRIQRVPTKYPAGGEKQLIRVLTGKEIPSDKLPLAFRVVCHNVGTAAAVYRAIARGEPLISRYVTVTGAVGTPRNFEVLIGTPVRELLEQADADPQAIERLVAGGPMMGFALPSADVPVVKTTNCILATGSVTHLAQRNAMPCIRCGACAEACPINLLPQQMYWYARAKDFDKVQDFNLFDCIECGCCDYVCPSQIPLVQYFRFAKTEIWNQEREKKKADAARERHEFRTMRLQREKEERAAKHKKKVAPVAITEPAAEDDKKAAIEAAVERAKARRTNEAAAAPEGADTAEATPTLADQPATAEK